jgi:hypothetical protein
MRRALPDRVTRSASIGFPPRPSPGTYRALYSPSPAEITATPHRRVLPSQISLTLWYGHTFWYAR